MKRFLQTGATLAVSLIIVFLISLLGVIGLRSAILEESMSRNMIDTTMSFQSAELGLKTAENWLLTLTTPPVPVASCGTNQCVLIFDPAIYLNAQTASWWSANSTSVTSGTVKGVYAQPQYVIQFLRFVPDNAGQLGVSNPSGQYFYRITARSVGKSSNAITTIASTFSRRF